MNTVYDTVTDSIIKALEAGTKPWRKSWVNSEQVTAMGIPLRACGTPYSGVNILILWSEAATKGYTLPHWFTYKQATALGAQVRKGEKSSQVVYYTKFKVEDKTTKEDKLIPLLKAYNVFNAGQIDGLPEKYTTSVAPTEISREDPKAWSEKERSADALLVSTGAVIHHRGNKAFYSLLSDEVTLPTVAQFDTTSSYIAVKGHELVHWTGNEARLNRTYGKRFGDQAYAFEELIAELGAAFLCASLGISDTPRVDHASYLASWLKVLKADKKAIFTAASAASKAADFILNGGNLKVSEKVEEIAA